MKFAVFGKTAIVTMAALVLLALPVVAVAQNGWATVDTRILLMFHPQMSGFDYSNGRFFREKVPDKDFNKVIARLQTAREKADTETAAIKSEQRKIQSQRFLLLQQLARAKTGLAAGDMEKLQKEKQTLETALQEVRNKKPATRDAEKLFAARQVDLRQRLQIIDSRIKGQAGSEGDEIEKNLQQKIDEIDTKLTELAAEIVKIEEKAVSAIYLTTPETEKRLDEITSEINALVSQAAAESKIAVVMDTSFAMRSPLRKDKMKMIPAVDESPDVVSSSLFHSFDNLTIDPVVKANITGPEGAPLPEEHLIVGRSLGMQSNLTQYLEFRNYMPERVAGFSTGRLFISGGTDLTPWVARKLFDRYKIPESVKNSFMVVLRRFLDFDKVPTTRERDY